MATLFIGTVALDILLPDYTPTIEEYDVIKEHIIEVEDDDELTDVLKDSLGTLAGDAGLAHLSDALDTLDELD